MLESKFSFWDYEGFAKGRENKGKEKKVFDWIKAAGLILEAKPKIAHAGLDGDWEETKVVIYENNKPYMADYSYLWSTWAVPTLLLDKEEIPCFVWANNTKFNKHTIWPKEALEILGVFNEVYT